MKEQTVNVPLLKSMMVRFGDNNQTLSDSLGMTRPTLSMKMYEKDGRCFDRVEMENIRQRYHLSDKDFLEIFFGSPVSFS